MSLPLSRRSSPAPSGVILDCLTLWASARFADRDESIANAWSAQLSAVQSGALAHHHREQRTGVGLGSPGAAGAQIRDLAGTLAQLRRGGGNRGLLMVAGCPLQLK